MEKKFRAVIPAAGTGSRSGLSYPKSLYPVGGLPILIRVCKALSAYDPNPIIIIHPDFENQFRDTLEANGQPAQIVFQQEPLGMGHAVLQAEPFLAPEEQVILSWSDLALLSDKTVDSLLKCHLVSENTFSLATYLGENCYTILKRVNGLVTTLVETRAEGIPPAPYGERDIGLFVFKKDPVFDVLRNQPVYSDKTGRKELGFLYVVSKLVEMQERCEGYPLAQYIETVSFNTKEELNMIEQFIATSGSK